MGSLPVSLYSSGVPSTAPGYMSINTAPPHRGFIYNIKGLLPQRLKRAFTGIEDKILGQSDCQFDHRGITLLIDVFIVDITPESFNENSIKGSNPLVNADCNKYRAGNGFLRKLYLSHFQWRSGRSLFETILCTAYLEFHPYRHRHVFNLHQKLL